MEQEKEYFIACPTCFPENIYGEELNSNTHLVRTFVYGAPGLESKEVEFGWELDGINSKNRPYHDIIGRSTHRGSIIDILMTGEGCGHYFIKRTYFHKGDVREFIISVNKEKVTPLLISLMDRD
jgi:hypothetical protein